MPSTVLTHTESSDPWSSALASLSEEDKAILSGVGSNILEDLEAIQQATEDKKRICEEKSWKIYNKKDGQKVTLRHLLEKMSVWVTESMKIVDTFIAFDKSGHAALPWAIIKLIMTGGISTIEKFSEMIEHVESVAGLLARYTAMEKLYLSENCDSTEQLRAAIVDLYASILTYLAVANKYFGGGTIKQIGRSVIEMFSHRYEELWAKVSDVQVDKWVAIVAAEMQSNRVKHNADQHIALKDILHRLDQPIMSMAADFSSVKDSLLEKQRSAMYQWLSKIKYREHHSTFSKDLLEDSGLWLLQSREYVQWAQSSVSSTFWLHGKPGAGKTRLTSQVIEQMKAKAKPSSCSIAYYYCDRTSPEPGRNEVGTILGTLLRQLASIDIGKPLRPAVVDEYNKYKKNASGDSSEPQQLSTEDCIKLAKNLTRDNQATMMIDAIDECDDKERYQLLQALDTIIVESEGLVKVFVSSRETTLLRDIMRHSAIIDTDTDANAADIARFVEEEVERLSTDKRLLRGRLVKNKRLRKKTIRKLKAGAQGMFRWVVLSLETLIAINHPNDFEESLGKLPPKLSELYDIIFKQLEQAGPHEQDIVKRLLQWLLCAQRVFSVDELIYAVSEPANFEAAQARASQTDHSSSGNTSADDEALSDEDPSLDGEDSYEDSTDTDPMLQAADIVLFCRSLLSHDLAQNTLRFSHQSVREYLLTKKANFVLQAHSLAMERCLWQIERLNINMEEIGIRTPPGVVATFASYALLFWPIHARETLQDRATVSDSSYSQAMNFLISGDELDAPYSEWNMCVNRLWKRSFPNADLLLRSVGGTPAPLFAICSFNLLSIMENTTFQESVNDWNCRNIEDQTALIIAAASGSSKIVHHLLAISTVEVNAQDRWGCTALSAAAAEGHEHIVELLLAIEEVDANLANLWDRTPVIHAAKLGNGAILAKLIDSGKSDPYRTDEEGLWALSMAAWEGHELMVKQLLNVPDIKVDYGGQGSRTALSCAVERGFQSIVELLLTTENVNVNATSRGTTILCHAIRTGNEEVVQLLLETGKLDVAAKNEDGSTALICAVEAKNETLVKLLLDLGKIDINARDQDGNTALMMAVTTESSSMVGLILDSGTANVHLKGWIARTEYTPLTLARWNEHDDIVKQLERYAALHQRSEDTEWFERYAALYPQAEDGDCSESE